jgi:hypothetical protein
LNNNLLIPQHYHHSVYYFLPLYFNFPIHKIYSSLLFHVIRIAGTRFPYHFSVLCLTMIISTCLLVISYFLGLFLAYLFYSCVNV